MRLSVHLVSWNGKKYIPYLFDSLRKQTYTDWQLCIWDNGSEDETVDAITRELQTCDVPYIFFQEKKNIGFAGGHNALYKKTTSEYIVLLNQDMYLEADCLSRLVQCMDAHGEAGIVSPRLMRWNFQAVEEGRLEESFTDVIDTLGLRVLRNRRVIEQYAQERWAEESLHTDVAALYHTKELRVFGVSGALPMCRKSAIDSIAFEEDGTFLDASYHSYKEDVDLAFRLRAAGFDSYTVLDAVAYHDRSAAGPRILSDAVAIKNKKQQSAWVQYHSYKNHLMTLYKNEYIWNVLRDGLWIIWYEAKKFFYFVLFDRTVLWKTIREIWTLRKGLKKKRANITSKRSLSATQMRIFWTKKQI